MNENLFIEIFRELLFDFLMIMGIDMAKGSFKKKPLSETEARETRLDADELARRILSKSDEPRAELFAFILSLAEEDPLASKTLLRRQMDRQECAYKTYPFRERERNERYELGDENKYVRLLTKLYVSLNGTGKRTADERSDELHARKATFRILGNMTDEEFDKMIEFLNQDTLGEWARRAMRKAQSGSKSAKTGYKNLASALWRFDAWLGKKGVR